MASLAGLAYGATSLYNYNRQTYKFDHDQSIERESFRIKMQIRRFELFREDVRDLVALTVDRMDIYFVVGALFLQFCILLLCEGRVQTAAPPFLLSLFLLSVASSSVYLLVAVWLSIHASIASHSFGTKLLTRFVRLPIPSQKQINALKFTLKDFEGSGLKQVLRVPGMSQKPWEAVNAVKEPVPAAKKEPPPWKESGEGGGGGIGGLLGAAAAAAQKAYLEVNPDSRLVPPLPRAFDDRADAAAPPSRGLPMAPPAGGPQVLPPRPDVLLPAEDEAPMPTGGDDLLSGTSGAMPERHIQLFRTLQAKWQNYDAYCRVCMSIGLNQILQGMSYFCVCHTLVENHSPSTGYVLVVALQSATVALAILDLAGLKRHEIILVQVMSIMPCFLMAFSISQGIRYDGMLIPDQHYRVSPFCFICQVIWLELWLRIAAPGTAEDKLPQRFRQMLFLDVFNDAGRWDPHKSGQEEDLLMNAFQSTVDMADEREEMVETAKVAASHLQLAQCAIRRYRAVPDWCFGGAQAKELSTLNNQMDTWGKAIIGELERNVLFRGIRAENEVRAWRLLREEERAADPFVGCLLGPFAHDGDDGRKMTYHYDAEQERVLFEDDASAWSSGALVLNLEAVATLLADLERHARALLEARIMNDIRNVKKQQPVRQRLNSLQTTANGIAGSDRCLSMRTGAKFSNLVSLFKDDRSHRGYAKQLDDRELPTTRLDSESGMSEGSSPGDSESFQAAVSRSPPRIPHANSNDPTLKALAGKDARHFVPEKLPWQVVSSLTRILQCCYLFVTFMAILKEASIYQVDFQQHPGGFERRLALAPQLEFALLKAEWPHGVLFRPRGLFPSTGRWGELVVASPFGLYAATLATDRLGDFRQLTQARLPAAAAVACGPSEPWLSLQVPEERCLLVTPLKAGLAFKSIAGGLQRQNSTLLPIEGEAWRLVTGAAVRCDQLKTLSWSLGGAAATWCLLIVGWDGTALPVAVVPLPHGPGRPPRPGQLVRPCLDAPLAAHDAAGGVLAVHLQPRQGRLWALLANGDLLAWDIFQGRRIGRWTPLWPTSSFRPAALSEDTAGSLLVIGRSEIAPAAAGTDAMQAETGPLLVQAELQLSENRAPLAEPRDIQSAKPDLHIQAGTQ